jgi:type I restriction enzyme R subunit
VLGDPRDYYQGWAVDLAQLRAFLAATQPPLVAAVDLDSESPIRQKSSRRAAGMIGKHGIIDVLRDHCRHDRVILDEQIRDATTRISSAGWAIRYSG